MRVIILAAGYGTRLYPLTRNTPKPLIKIHGKPIINFLLDKITLIGEKFPIKEVCVVTNDKFYTNFLAWKKTCSVKVEILNDGSTSPDDRLGALRDIKFAMGDKKDDWLVLGGDNLFEDNLKDFVKFAKTKKDFPVMGLYDVKSKKVASRYGVVEVNRQKQIIRMEEKPKNPFSTLAASCVYYFPKNSHAWLDKFLSDGERKDASGRYIAWLIDKTKVYGYQLKGRWVDIGHIDTLKEAERDFKPAIMKNPKP